ncbi:uncharacterized protein EV420DRAFT_433076 [Desarmillaria tabescens]|uniref:Uncharacterized protein n=1 Tax=Armillaria tabescens TaxID=1929756 RepID=A0AA39NLM3_ARMTA|nr:uncharacterized protein EV420DRAFT_433076 [Desarmillaria tabescens]KAK0467886.1 hypothetical protein EV420DRAFT_433076 [Desarmillaria tabescens]
MPPGLELLSSLCIPQEFSRYEKLDDAEIIQRLQRWKSDASQVLFELQTLLSQHDENLSLEDQVDIVASVVPFEGEDPWVVPKSREISMDILHRFHEPDVRLLKRILTHNVKPLFLSTPHPSLNLSTGRKLPRLAGGPMASQDYYEEQTWKEHPETASLVSFVVRNIRSEDYEDLWHLVIPSVMSLLDDYEARYKIKGVRIVSEMLQKVPKTLLKRTGIDGLILSSLNNCLGHLKDPESPELLRAAISANLSLILLTTEHGTTQQFDQLCALLGDGIIGTVWLYASDSFEVILATVEALPPLMKALDIGIARYLKALVPQLVHPLYPNSVRPTPVVLQKHSLIALVTVINECSPRIGGWKGTILDGVGRCWVALQDVDPSRNDDGACEELKELLRSTCKQLANACPSVIQE